MTKIYGESVKINHNLNWPYIPNHPFIILTIGGLGSGKTNVLLNLIKHQRPDIKKRKTKGIMNQIFRRYLYICKHFLAYGIVSTITLILHKTVISTKCLTETLIIT